MMSSKRKRKFPPESEDYEIELTAMKLLQLLQARGKGSGAMLQIGASRIEDQAVRRTNDAAEEFDTMLVDYAKKSAQLQGSIPSRGKEAHAPAEHE